ncbi:hypothetical protein Ct9H90mP29_00690 [bacterium]|jgi:hypothetical protein|nr:MAG: hypothetical protein Ct9H90mP29_00690 [bacterium]|tara:strand:- start:87 stop:650 length:564 start_codon:yes stop_codon:yes gene_type:complete
MNTIYGRILLLFILTIFGSCTIYEKLFDNPVDFKANEERGIGAPSFVFYPKTQSVTQNDSILVGSFIVFQEDSIEPFAGVHLQIEFPNDLIELDTILPGLFITDTNKSTPLFTYTYNNESTVDIYTYFLDTLKQDINGTGHLADLIFNPVSSGSDSIYYNLGECEMIDHLDQEIIVNGIRGAEVIIE